MRRPLILTAIATAVLLGAASPASAAAGDYYADGTSSVNKGTGSAVVNLEADPSGDLAADASATGGTQFLVPILNLGPYSNESRAAGTAYLTTSFPVEEAGTYEVTVTFQNAIGEESATGNGQAEAEAYARAYLPEGEGSRTLGSDAAALPGSAGTVVLQFEVELTDGFSISAELQSTATATGAGSAASAEASAQDISVSFTQID